MKIWRVRIGMRTFKTALSVVIGLYLSHLLNLQAPIFTAIASITTMQPSFTDTSEQVKRRLFTCVFGVVFGYLLAQITNDPLFTPILAGIGVIFTIVLHQLTGQKNMTTLACIVFVASFATRTNHMTYGINRLIGTFLGVAISVLINVLIRAPKVHEDFFQSVQEAYQEIFDLTRSCLLLPYPSDLTQLEATINKVNNYYNMLDEEMHSPFYSGKDFQIPHSIIEVINEIYLRFQLLEELKPFTPTIFGKNVETIEKLFSYTILYQGDLKRQEAVVYNYHIEVILKDVSRLKNFVESHKAEMEAWKKARP